jgi:hypothetical protein
MSDYPENYYYLGYSLMTQACNVLYDKCAEILVSETEGESSVGRPFE